MVMPHNQLRINEDIRREDQRTQHTIDKLHGTVERQEHGHKPEQNHEPQRAKQVRHPVREVVLGLAGEERQGDEDAQRQNERLHDDLGVVEGCYHADGVGFEEGEAGEEEEVCGVGLALPVCCEHEAEGAEDGDYHEPEVGLNPCSVGGVEEGDGAEDGCEEELGGSGDEGVSLLFEDGKGKGMGMGMEFL